MASLQFGSITDLSELEALGRLLMSCFQFRDWSMFVDRVGQENLVRVRQGERIVAGLGIYRAGQWLGGECLPMAAIAAVGVAPEVRGQGVAAHLLRETLQQLHHEGIPIATLYASTQRLYRKVGFEPAGNNCRYSLDVTSLQPFDRDLPMYPLDPAQDSILRSLYTRWAHPQMGLMERSPGLWDRRRASETPIEVFGVGDTADPQGYILYDQPDVNTMAIRDLIALTPAAARRIWTFIADHRSLVKQASWYGPVVDPHLSLLPEQTFQVDLLERWLLRIIHVPQALQMRGYPADLEAELHLQVEDDLIPANSEPLILSISQGKAEVKPGGRADLQISIRGLAPLFTGLLTPVQLQWLGYGQGSAETLATATRIFAGSEPWFLDRF